MIHFVLPAANEWTAREYLSRWGRGLADRFRILHYEELAARTSFDRGTYVLAGLQLDPHLQHVVEQLHRSLSGVQGVRFLNHPTRTLRRYDLLRELRRRHLNDFGAARLADDVASLKFPIFLRSEEEHSGALSPLLRSSAEIEGAIGRALWHGYRMEDLLAVEFCDTADADGYYRKYGAYILGDRILAKNMEYGRRWMLKHAACEFSEKMILEERAYIFANPHAEQLRSIFEVAGVEYGRIDYAVKDGRIQTWEINLHPTIGRGPGEERRSVVPAELEPLRQVGKEHFHKGFTEAWKAVDLPSDGPPVEVRFDETRPRPRRPRPVRRAGLLRLVRIAARPLKPLVEPLLRPVFPLLARMARRGQR